MHFLGAVITILKDNANICGLSDSILIVGCPSFFLYGPFGSSKSDYRAISKHFYVLSC